MRFSLLVAFTLVLALLAGCKKDSESLATSNIQMEVGVISQNNNETTKFRARLIDYSQGEPSYLTLPTWLELSGGDRLAVTSNNKEYYFSDLDEGNGIYSIDIPSVSPNKFGVILRRSKGVDAETGSIELFYRLSLDLPIDGAVFQSSDAIEAKWSLNGEPPSEAVAANQLRTTIELSSCIDAAGNVILENDPDRNPGAPFGWPQLTSDTLVASGKELLDLAVGSSVLEENPNVYSCKVKLGASVESYLTETGTNSVVEAYVDPTLAIQEWSVLNQSNTIEVTILRE